MALPAALLVLGISGAWFLLWHFAQGRILEKRHASELKSRGCVDAAPMPSRPSTSRWWDIRGHIASTMEQWRLKTTLKRMTEARGQGLQTCIHFGPTGTQYLVTSEPENAKAVLISQAQDFEPWRNSHYTAFVGKGILTTVGMEWRHARRRARAQFGREQLADLGLQERHLQNLLARIEQRTEDNGTPGSWTRRIDMRALIQGFAMDSVTEVMFGRSTKSLVDVGPDSEGRLFIKHLMAAGRSMSVYADAKSKFWFFGPPSFSHGKNYIHGYVDRCVEAAQQHNRSVRHSGSGEKPDRTKRLHLLGKLVEETNDPLQLRGEVINLFLAAQVTTAALAGTLFFYLSRHTHVFHKLRGAILADFGAFDDSKDVTVTGNDLNQCHYLQHCMRETLRLVPPGAVTSRQSIRDTVLPVGDDSLPIFVPKGMKVILANQVRHTRPDIWGDDAYSFRPERWEGRNVEHEYLPFSAGPRSCIGQSYALTQTAYFTIRMLQRFDKLEPLDFLSEEVKFSEGVISHTETVMVKLRKAAS